MGRGGDAGSFSEYRTLRRQQSKAAFSGHSDVRELPRRSMVPAGITVAGASRKSHVDKGSCAPKPRDWRDIGLADPNYRRAKKPAPPPGCNFGGAAKGGSPKAMFMKERNVGAPAHIGGAKPAWLQGPLRSTERPIMSMLSVMNLPLNQISTLSQMRWHASAGMLPPPFANISARSYQPRRLRGAEGVSTNIYRVATQAFAVGQRVASAVDKQAQAPPDKSERGPVHSPRETAAHSCACPPLGSGAWRAQQHKASHPTDDRAFVLEHRDL
jgi:hypothetical protein